MKAQKANVTKPLPLGAFMVPCDNSGAKMVQLIAIKGAKPVKNRVPSAGIGDLVQVTVKTGKPDVRKKVFFAIIVRQKKEYKRPDGMRVKFEDNSVILLKDDKGNPKGTIFKGPIAKEVVDRWPAAAKVANMIL